MKFLRSATVLSGLLGGALVLAACGFGAGADSQDDSSGAENSGAGSQDGSDADVTGGDGVVEITMRLWDEQAAEAYRDSFEAFHETQDDIRVTVNHIPWDSYWDKLRADVSADTVDDIFWVNAYYFGDYADNGNLLEIGDEFSDLSQGWESSSIEQYTRDGSLWGVPQIIDGGKALYVNSNLVAEAGVDVADLRWDPTGTDDTFLPALQSLTQDSNGVRADESGFNGDNLSQYGFNAAYDIDAIVGNFIGSNGGQFQTSERFVFAEDPKSVAAIEYVVDLINEYHVAPAAADTNDDGEFSRNQFLQGKMALFESGAYNLAYIAENANFDWELAPIPAGPEGRISITNSVIAAANAHAEHSDAVLEVLRWIGSAEGNAALGASGAAIPAVTAAQQSYFDFWDEQGVDARIFPDALSEGVLDHPVLGNAASAQADLIVEMKEVFAGRTSSTAEGLLDAQTLANNLLR